MVETQIKSIAHHMNILQILKSFTSYISSYTHFFVCLYMPLKTIPILVQNQIILHSNCSHTKKPTLQPTWSSRISCLETIIMVVELNVILNSTLTYFFDKRSNHPNCETRVDLYMQHPPTSTVGTIFLANSWTHVCDHTLIENSIQTRIGIS